MKYFFLLFFSISFCLFSENFESEYNCTVEAESSIMLENCVNLLTGLLYINDVDIIADGKEPIYYSKSYTSIFNKYTFKDLIYRWGQFEEARTAGWGGNKHVMAYLGKDSSKKAHRRLDLYEPNGVMLAYDFPEIKEPKVKLFESKKKKNKKYEQYDFDKRQLRYLTLINNNNFYQKAITSAKDNYKNISVLARGEKNLKIKFADGRIRHYHRKDEIADIYHLEWEVLPNGNLVQYTLKGPEIDNIKSFTPNFNLFSSINFSFYAKDHCNFTEGVTNTNKKIIYKYRYDKIPDDHNDKYQSYPLREKINPYVSEIFDYYDNKSFLLKSLNYPNKRCFGFDYYYEKKQKNFKKVSEIKTFLNGNSNPTTIYKIYYEKVAELNRSDGQTNVIDANGNETRYFFNKDLRLEKIERYEQLDGVKKLKNIELFIWGKNSSEGFLLGKVFYDENKTPIKAIKNIFDQKGNILKEILFGNITGVNSHSIILDGSNLPISNGVDTYTKEYSYTENNNLKSFVDENGQRVEFTYKIANILTEDFETNLISTKLIIYNNEIKQRTFYTYDSDLILIEEIIDDGSSYNKDDLTSVTKRSTKRISPRTTQPFGLTDILEEYYLDPITHEEKLLKKEKYEYSLSTKITKKHVYGSDGIGKYVLYYEYDSVTDNLISETNPIGLRAEYRYDTNNNRVYEKTFDGKEIFYEYDYSNRLICKTTKKDDSSFFEKYQYDAKNNKIFEQNIFGQIKRYEYDSYGKVTKEIFSQVDTFNGSLVTPIKTYKYDALERQILKSDSSDNTTKIFYNILDEPILIIYSDNTKEEFEYNQDGTLKCYIAKNGSQTHYQYDYLKRVVSKKIFSLKNTVLSEEFFVYDAFDLISKVEPNKIQKKYTYDATHRKTKEEIFDVNQNLLSKEEFFYDSLGFLNKIIKCNLLIKEYEKDFLGRILQEKQSNISGKVLRQIQYQFDDLKNEQITTSFIANKTITEKKSFDLLNRIIKEEDGLKNITYHQYDTVFDQRLNYPIVRKITTNALNQKTIVTYSIFEKEKTIEKLNPQKQKIFFEEKYYDLRANLSALISHEYVFPNVDAKKTITLWEYDIFNRAIKNIEAFATKLEKVTKTEYLNFDLTKIITKPDGNQIIYQYDELANNIRMHCNVINKESFFGEEKDYEIDYLFTYNKSKQPIEILDKIHTQKTLRKYDDLGHLLQEKLANDFIIKNEYDFYGNRTKTYLPDSSYIEYFYDPINLVKVVRKDNIGQVLYEHEFLDYDLSGNLLKEKLLNNLSVIEYDFDDNNKVSSIKSKFHTQKIYYDEINRVKMSKFEGFVNFENFYEYDDLNQLISEKGLFNNSYQFDSQNNRIEKNSKTYQINDLNQIQTDEKSQFLYDKNGNLLFRKNLDQETRYYYDVLDRLVRIEKKKDSYEYTYDSFNRRISKNCKYNTWIMNQDFRYFLYDAQNEIGSYDQDLKIKDLRILSHNKNAELGSAIAFEINDYLYTPLYDFRGNVTSLIYKDYICEHYRYSVFGERKIFSTYESEIDKTLIYNPWQYSSKRYDEESNLIYFGNRYYDPDVGRWITPDPKGYVDGINLYAYVYNDPLMLFDLYGLSVKNLIRKYYSKEYLPVVPDEYFASCVDWSEALPHKDPSRSFDLNRKEPTNKRIGFINGIDTSSKEALEYAEYISDMIGGYNVHVTYNQKTELTADIVRAAYEIFTDYKSKSGDLLSQEWINFLSQNESNKYYQVCHSEGAAIVRNQIRALPKKYQDRIEILAVAPAAYTNNEFCGKIRHICSESDIVPKFDRKGRKENMAFTQILTPYPGVKGWDHSFNSPTYYDDIKYQSLKFLNK